MNDDCWSIRETQFEAAANRASEGLVTFSGGCLHLRGLLEEHLLEAPRT